MSYYFDRISTLKLKFTTAKLTRVHDNDAGSYFDVDWIEEGKNGEIHIFPFNLKRQLYQIERNSTSTGVKWEILKYTRYTPEQAQDKGHKAHFPKGITPPPFIPLQIIEKYEKNEIIDTLILTEGYIKAIKGANEGLDIIGLPSITIYKDRDTGVLFNEIYEIINICKVRNVILLYDADCLNISEKGGETTKRPKSFISSALNIRDLLRAENDLNVFFARIGKKECNGLDDILIKYPESAIIFSDLRKLDSVYCKKTNITRNDKALNKLFCIDNVESFYQLHKQILKENEFIFFGNKYQFRDEKVVRIYDEIEYFRVGDDFFQVLTKMDKNNNPKIVYDFRKRQTIIDDKGEGIIKQMPKYNAFCNIPDNSIEYRRIHYNCFNVFAQNQHEIKEGEFPTIEKLLRHVFGSNDITITHPITGNFERYNEYEIGLDYIQILWQNPTQILPILGIVSICRHTGKTTFMNFLNDLFGDNSIIIFMSELASEFNAAYANKILIMADETKLDNKDLLEKMKSLSTAKTININFKFSQKHTVNFYGKIILSSNHEHDFITTSKDEIRFWVRKINKIDFYDPLFEKKLKNEIPAFIYFLNNRELTTKKESRMHFLPEIIYTEALQKVIDNSKTNLFKNLQIYFSEFFANNDLDEIQCTATEIKNMWFTYDNNITPNYISKVLTLELGLDNSKQQRYHSFDRPEQKNGNPFTIKRDLFNVEKLNENPPF